MDTFGEYPSDDDDAVMMELADESINRLSRFEIVDTFKMNDNGRLVGSQYNLLYKSRHQLMSPRIKSLLQSSFPTMAVVSIGNLFIKESNHASSSKPAFTQRVAIIGTIIKDHGSVRLVTKYMNMPDVPSVSGTMYAEDDTAKVELAFTASLVSASKRLVNGLVCGMIGKTESGGHFVVDDFVFAQPKSSIVENPKFIFKMIFVSGILHKQQHLERLEKLFSVLKEHATNAKGELFVFFVGNSLDVSNDQPKDQLEAIAHIDKHFADLAKIAHVFVVPGMKDPVAPMLPHAPIHNSVLPLSTKMEKFHPLTNPARVKMPCTNPSAFFDALLSSGEIVEDLCVGTGTKDAEEATKLMLLVGHIGITAPDTTIIRPDLPADFCVLEQAPTLFVVGNQKKSLTTKYHSSTLSLLPIYAETLVIRAFVNDTTAIDIKVQDRSSKF